MGLENLNWWEMIGLLLLGLFIFGPERLPKVIGEGLGMLRQLRQMARNATGDLSRELGTDIKLEDLHPKALVRKHLLSEEDEAELRRPLDDLYGELRSTADSLDAEKALGGPGASAAAGSPAEPATAADRRQAFDDAT